MKILLLGKNGQIGWELQRTLAPLGHITALGRQELDLTETPAIRSAVRSTKPDLIVNAAAYTDVKKAEEEPELAMVVNGIAPGILAEEAALCKAAMVHYSTDYVFDGKKNLPYIETDIPNPLNTYGKTKLAGEDAVFRTEGLNNIFRTSWVYSLRGHNFLRTILHQASEKEELSIVNDQCGSPTWARMIAEATAQFITYNRSGHNLKGLYHLTAAGYTSWHGFAEEIIKLKTPHNKRVVSVNAVSTSDYPTAVIRPKYSVLDSSLLESAAGLRLPHWQNSLSQAME